MVHMHKWKALKNFAFRRYILSQLVSSIGTNQQNTVLTWLTYQMTNSPGWVAIQITMTQIPVILFSSFTSHYIERYGYKRILSWCAWAGAAQAALMGLAAVFDFLSLGMIIFLTAVHGIAATFELNARQNLVSTELPADQLVSGVTLNGISIGIGRLLGASLLILWNNNYKIIFFFNALTFIGVAFASRLLKDSVQEKPHHQKSITVAQAMQSYLKSHYLIPSYFIFTISLGLLGGFLTPSLPLIAKAMSGNALQMLSFLTTWSSLGNFVSSFSLPKRDNLVLMRRSTTFHFGLLIICSLVLGFGQSSVHILFTALMVGIFNFSIWSSVLLFRYKIQQTIPSHLRAKVIGVHSTLLVGSVALGGLVSGDLLERIGLGGLYGASSLFCLVLGIFAFTRLRDRRKKVRDLSGPPHPAAYFFDTPN